MLSLDGACCVTENCEKQGIQVAFKSDHDFQVACKSSEMDSGDTPTCEC